MFSNPIQVLYLFLALCLCIPVHEASHALVAFWLGDPTAKAHGRISLNPRRHLDFLGTILIFLVHFGWGIPTPINPRNLAHPRRDEALIAFAGPLSNLFLAFLLGTLLVYLPADLPLFVRYFFEYTLNLSLVLFLFNLLPFAPLDGSKIIQIFVPKRYRIQYHAYLERGPVLLITLVILDRLLSLFFGFSLFGFLLTDALEYLRVLIGISS
ncbi:site-2 protease family protein [Candidatus Peregrinibacteria bacterium]|nr:MAG: site-2 protease family protein [Candidatus Peregrinibacteria bacterium]